MEIIGYSQVLVAQLINYEGMFNGILAVFIIFDLFKLKEIGTRAANDLRDKVHVFLCLVLIHTEVIAKKLLIELVPRDVVFPVCHEGLLVLPSRGTQLHHQLHRYLRCL